MTNHSITNKAKSILQSFNRLVKSEELDRKKRYYTMNATPMTADDVKHFHGLTHDNQPLIVAPSFNPPPPLSYDPSSHAVITITAQADSLEEARALATIIGYANYETQIAQGAIGPTAYEMFTKSNFRYDDRKKTVSLEINTSAVVSESGPFPTASAAIEMIIERIDDLQKMFHLKKNEDETLQKNKNNFIILPIRDDSIIEAHKEILTLIGLSHNVTAINFSVTEPLLKKGERREDLTDEEYERRIKTIMQDIDRSHFEAKNAKKAATKTRKKNELDSEAQALAATKMAQSAANAEAAQNQQIELARTPKPATSHIEDIQKELSYLENSPPTAQRDTAKLIADTARRLADVLDVRDDAKLEKAAYDDEPLLAHKEKRQLHRDLAEMLLSPHNIQQAAVGLGINKIPNLNKHTSTKIQENKAKQNTAFLQDHPDAIEFLRAQCTEIAGLPLLIMASTSEKPELQKIANQIQSQEANVDLPDLEKYKGRATISDPILKSIHTQENYRW